MPNLKIVGKIKDLRRKPGSTALKVVILAFVLWAFISNSSGGGSSPDSTQSQDNTLFPATVAVEPSPPFAEEDNSEPVTKLPKKLKVRVKKFLTNYYLVNSSDTTSSRANRVKPYVAPAFIPKLDLGVNLAPGQFVRGAVIASQMTASPGPNSRALIVSAPVRVVQKRRYGSNLLTESTETVYTTTAWSSKRTKSNPHRRWMLQSTG